MGRLRRRVRLRSPATPITLPHPPPAEPHTPTARTQTATPLGSQLQKISGSQGFGGFDEPIDQFSQFRRRTGA